MKRFALVVVVLLVAAVLVFMLGKKPQPLDPELESAKRLQPGPHKVTYFDVTLTDGTRPTQATADYEGSDSRELKTRIWYPADLLEGGAESPRPLLIYSHGFMSMRTGGAYLAEHMASLGYIVASMDFPLTSFGGPGDPYVVDVVNQPGDVSFLLDKFLSWNSESGHQFEGAIDEQRIGVMGLSLGGMTSTLVAFHPRLHDPRVDVAVSIAGPGFMFSERFYRTRELPFMMVASPIDALVEYSSNAAPVPELVPNSLLVTIDHATHTGFAEAAAALRWMDNPDALGCRQVKANLESTSEDAWFSEIGTPEEGIVAGETPPLCELDPLPPGMNPIRQHWLNQLAVSSFFQAHFADDPAERRSARAFLMETLPTEIAEVSVQAGAGKR